VIVGIATVGGATELSRACGLGGIETLTDCAALTVGTVLTCGSVLMG
jgi:hypothetical protein